MRFIILALVLVSLDGWTLTSYGLEAKALNSSKDSYSQEVKISQYDFSFQDTYTDNSFTNTSALNATVPRGSGFFYNPVERVMDPFELYFSSELIDLMVEYIDDTKDVNATSAYQQELVPSGDLVFYTEEQGIKFKERDTMFYGGMLPFFALPDSNLESNDKVLNKESISFFLYFKTKF